MAQITAAMVKDLRERTGQPMMDCKKALGETDGDVDKAIEMLRKKGLAVMEKRGERETKEGRIISLIADDGKTAAMTMLCSETDFTSKSDAFGKVAQALADGVMAADACPCDADAVAGFAVDGRTVGDFVNDIVSQTGEKITIGQCSKFKLDNPGLLFSYVHFNGKIGTLVQIDAENDAAANNDATKELAADIAMHITAANPTAVTRDEVDPEVVAKEREIATEQVKGKPANIIDQIVEGKLNKWYQQIVLLEQPFVKDDSKTVGELVDQVSKKVGAKLTIKRFARLQIG